MSGRRRKFRPVKRAGDYLRTFSVEDGKIIRGHHQELGPAMERTKMMMEAEASRGKNAHDKQYIGSIPTTVLTDWLNERGYTLDQWARNEGGTRCPPGADPVSHATLDGGIKSEFLRYFLSRDFSKLHTQHVTTKRDKSQILMPGG